MKEKIKNKNVFIILIILSIITIIAIGTYALFVWNSDKNTELTMRIGDISEVLFEDGNDINIYIGKENNLDEDMTIIETNYKTPQEEGKLVVIGPKRMEYDRVVSLLEFIKENIEK